MKFLFLSLFAGLVAACGFEPIGWWPLSLGAFALLLWLVERAPSLRSALARGWWFGIGLFTLGNNWIATAFTYQAAMPPWLGWIAVVLLALYLAVYPAVAAGLAWRHGRSDRLRLVLLFAAAWIVAEWLRATLFTGFAWNPVGVVLLPTHAAYLAGVVGTYGLSGFVLLIAGALLLLLERGMRRAIVLFAALAVAIVLAPLGLKPAPAGPKVAVRIVQPNVGQEDRWRPGAEDEALALLGRLSQAASPAPRLLLWPESAVTAPLEDGRADPARARAAAAVRARVAGMLGPRDMLLTGGITVQSRDGVAPTSATNSVFAIAAGQILGRYDKAHLVPYGEYLPMRPLLSAIGLSRLAPGDIDFDAGPGPRTLALPGIGKAGLQLCYEIIFSGEVVDRSDRPDFIFNPSNDAWFGAWGPPQHLAQARLRAIEEGLPVLRATPTGISAVIDADGTLIDSLPWHVAGAIDATLPAARPPTPFAHLGNLLPFALALILAAAAIAVPRKTR